MERCAMWWWCLFLTIIRTIYMEPMEPYNSGSIQIGSIDIGSYQSGSQLVLLPIWLPIGAVTNLAPNWCRYQSGFQWVFVMTSWRRKLSTERHPLEVIVKKVPIWRYQFGFELVAYYRKWNTITNLETDLERPHSCEWIALTAQAHPLMQKKNTRNSTTSSFVVPGRRQPHDEGIIGTGSHFSYYVQHLWV